MLGLYSSGKKSKFGPGFKNTRLRTVSGFLFFGMVGKLSNRVPVGEERNDRLGLVFGNAPYDRNKSAKG